MLFLYLPYLHVVGMLVLICLPQATEQAKALGLTPNLRVEKMDVELLVHAGEAERGRRDCREVVRR